MSVLCCVPFYIFLKMIFPLLRNFVSLQFHSLRKHIEENERGKKVRNHILVCNAKGGNGDMDGKYEFFIKQNLK